MIAIIRKQQSITSGKIKLEIKPVDTKLAIQEAMGLFAERAKKKRIQLVMEGVPNLWISGDKTVLVYSILANIVSNALKFFDNKQQDYISV